MAAESKRFGKVLGGATFRKNLEVTATQVLNRSYTYIYSYK